MAFAKPGSLNSRNSAALLIRANSITGRQTFPTRPGAISSPNGPRRYAPGLTLLRSVGSREDATSAPSRAESVFLTGVPLAWAVVLLFTRRATARTSIQSSATS